ncbi:hypothetical protein Tco_0666769 [Tanacetum coccineum]
MLGCRGSDSYFLVGLQKRGFGKRRLADMQACHKLLKAYSGKSQAEPIKEKEEKAAEVVATTKTKHMGPPGLYSLPCSGHGIDGKINIDNFGANSAYGYIAIAIDLSLMEAYSESMQPEQTTSGLAAVNKVEDTLVVTTPLHIPVCGKGSKAHKVSRTGIRRPDQESGHMLYAGLMRTSTLKVADVILDRFDLSREDSWVIYPLYFRARHT